MPSLQKTFACTLPGNFGIENNRDFFLIFCGLRFPGNKASEGKKVYTKGVFSSENSSASTGKKEAWCMPKSLFWRENFKRREKTYTPKSLPGVCGGHLFAQHWCINFGLLKHKKSWKKSGKIRRKIRGENQKFGGSLFCTLSDPRKGCVGSSSRNSWGFLRRLSEFNGNLLFFVHVLFPQVFLGLPCLQKCVVTFLVKFDLKFEISDVKNLVKFGGKTFRPARKAPKCSGRILGRISANFSETSFQISHLFSETSFSRRAVLRFFGVHSRLFSATRTPDSRNHSYLLYSLCQFTGEWFTNHSNHIHIFTPIARIVATKLTTLIHDIRYAKTNHRIKSQSNSWNWWDAT